MIPTGQELKQMQEQFVQYFVPFEQFGVPQQTQLGLQPLPVLQQTQPFVQPFMRQILHGEQSVPIQFGLLNETERQQFQQFVQPQQNGQPPLSMESTLQELEKIPELTGMTLAESASVFTRLKDGPQQLLDRAIQLKDMAKEVYAALETDEAYRFVGATGDLIRLDDIKFRGPWRPWRANHLALPTIIPRWLEGQKEPVAGMPAGSFTTRGVIEKAMKSKVRDDMLAALAPFLGDGLIVAGGAVAHTLSVSWELSYDYDAWSGGDVDLFLVGLTGEEAERRIARFCQDVKAVKVYRTAYTMTIQNYGDNTHEVEPPRFPIQRIYPQGFMGLETKTPSEPVKQETKMPAAPPKLTQEGPLQIVLRQYKTMNEVLLGFDMGSVAVAFDGQYIYMTTLGRLALERGFNILDLAKRRDTYEKRLAKYFWRGYGLILPNLGSLTLPISQFPQGPPRRLRAGDHYDTNGQVVIMPYLKLVSPKRYGPNWYMASRLIRGGSHDKSATWQLQDDYSIPLVDEVRHSPERLNLLRCWEAKDGILDAEITKMVGESHYCSLEASPILWSPEDAISHARGEFVYSDKGPYLLLLRIMFGMTGLTAMLNTAVVEENGDVKYQVEKADWQDLARIYEHRISRVRALKFSKQLLQSSEGTRLTEAIGIIPNAPITDKDWYGAWYQP